MEDVIILKKRVISCQVCVKKGLSDQHIENITNALNPTGISYDWRIVKDGEDPLNGDPERVQCNDYEDREHLLLIC